MAEDTHAFDPALLRGGGSLRAHGVEPTREPTWTQVRHGVWIPRSAWEALSPEARYAAFVHATASQCADSAELVFSHWSAAVVLGMPRVDAWPRHVDVLVTGPRVRSSTWVLKHAGRAVEPVTVLGVRVTPPARTVVDVARTAPLACAVAAADHALRVGLCTRDELAAELDLLRPGDAGSRRARVVVGIADARSMSVGESLSRARMYELDLPRPQLQVAYRDDDGLIGFADFDWNGVVGEMDGKRKYGIPDGSSAAQATDVLWREKKREDRLRLRCRALVRWDWATAISADRFRRRLAHVGIVPQPRNTWLEECRAAS